MQIKNPVVQHFIISILASIPLGAFAGVYLGLVQILIIKEILPFIYLWPMLGVGGIIVFIGGQKLYKVIASRFFKVK